MLTSLYRKVQSAKGTFVMANLSWNVSEAKLCWNTQSKLLLQAHSTTIMAGVFRTAHLVPEGKDLKTTGTFRTKI